MTALRSTRFSQSLRAGLVAALLMLAVPAFSQEQTWKINLKNADINDITTRLHPLLG